MRRYDDIDDFDNLDINDPTNDDFSLQPFTPPADVNNSESDDFSCGGGGGGRRKRRTHEHGHGHGHGHGYGGGFNWEILEIIGIIILIIAVISFIVVNRDAIEQFVQQILHWAVLLFIAFILIRIIIRKI